MQYYYFHAKFQKKQGNTIVSDNLYQKITQKLRFQLAFQQNKLIWQLIFIFFLLVVALSSIVQSVGRQCSVAGHMTADSTSHRWEWVWSVLGGCGIAPRGSWPSSAATPGHSTGRESEHAPHQSQKMVLKCDKINMILLQNSHCFACMYNDIFHYIPSSNLLSCDYQIIMM